MKKIKTFKTRNILKNADKCACYYCLSEFLYDEINKFVDNNETAVCPKCGIDSVIGDNQVEDSFEEAKDKMHINSFCWGYRSSDINKKQWYPTKIYKDVLSKKYNNKLKFFEFSDE